MTNNIFNIFAVCLGAFSAVVIIGLLAAWNLAFYDKEYIIFLFVGLINLPVYLYVVSKLIIKMIKGGEND